MNKIGYNTRKLVYEHAIDHFGIKHQLLMVIEGMIELAKEICKSFRDHNNTEEIAEKVADVIIALEQLRLIFGLNDRVCEIMDEKVRRLAEDRLKLKGWEGQDNE